MTLALTVTLTVTLALALLALAPRALAALGETNHVPDIVGREVAAYGVEGALRAKLVLGRPGVDPLGEAREGVAAFLEKRAPVWRR